MQVFRTVSKTLLLLTSFWLAACGSRSTFTMTATAPHSESTGIWRTPPSTSSFSRSSGSAHGAAPVATLSVDNISTVAMLLADSTIFTGAINAANTGTTLDPSRSYVAGTSTLHVSLGRN